MSKQTGIVLTGDWRRLNAILRKLNTTPKYLNKLIQFEANRIRDELIEEIKDFNGVPNTASTERRKGFNNPLVEHGVLGSKDGIIVNEIEESAKKRYFVVQGNPDKVHERTGLTYEDVAEIMELGGSGAGGQGIIDIPSRPVFTITFDRLKADMINSIIMKAREDFKGRLR